MAHTNNKGFTDAEYPPIGDLVDADGNSAETGTKQEALRLIYSMYHGHLSLEHCLRRLARTDWTTLTDADKVTPLDDLGPDYVAGGGGGDTAP